MPLPELTHIPFVLGFVFGSGMSLKLIFPVPLPEVTYFIPLFLAASLDAS